MLPKQRRIPRSSFKLILGSKDKYSSPHLFLSVVNIQKENPSRFSFCVSKKIFSKAVDRNKHRRWGYSSIEYFLNNIKTGKMLFFSFKKGDYPITYQNLRKEVEALLNKSFMLR